MSQAEPTFRDLVEYFTLEQLPFSVTPETYNSLGDEGKKPIPESLALLFLNFQDEPYDEFTEFVPIAWLMGIDEFFCLVMWRANLHGERYLLCTFDKTGQFIDKAELAGTFYTDKGLSYAVGAVSKDLQVFVKGGLDKVDAASIWDENAQGIIRYTILDNGQIELML